MTISLQQALAYIHSFKNYELTAPQTIPEGAWDLSRITTFLSLLDDPHRAYPLIHIAGSKGKGSTAAFCTQMLMAAGLRAGLYVSPHLLDFRERIQVDRQHIAPDALAKLVEDVKPYADSMPDLTWFELLTALAFWHFAREGVDVAVIEVGLGGRLDATNVVTPLVSVITRLGLDHVELLGDTLAEIAAEKAAIIKPGVPVVSGPQDDEAMAVVERVATQKGSPLSLVLPASGARDNPQSWIFQPAAGNGLTLTHGGEQWSYPLGLAGTFQAENAAVAVAAMNAVRDGGLRIPGEAIARGLRATRWRGRFDMLQDAPRLIVDSAHNPQSARVLAGELARLTPGPSWTLVFGCMADKDVNGMLVSLLPTANRVILTQAQHPRAMPARGLLEYVRAGWPDIGAVSVRQTVSEALALALEGASERDNICVAGSLAVAGEATAAWERQSAPPDESYHQSMAPSDYPVNMLEV